MLYYLAQCPKCGEIQNSYTTTDITKSSFKCRRCNASRTIFSKRTRTFRVRVYKTSDNPSHLAKLAQKMSEELARIGGNKNGI